MNMLVVLFIHLTLLLSIAQGDCEGDNLPTAERAELLKVRDDGSVCPQTTLFFCPDFECSVKLCTKDSECEKGDLCCVNNCHRHTCTKALTTQPRPGQCPKEFSCDLMSDTAICRYDEDCFGKTQKCCQDDNLCDGAIRCVEPGNPEVERANDVVEEAPVVVEEEPKVVLEQSDLPDGGPSEGEEEPVKADAPRVLTEQPAIADDTPELTEDQPVVIPEQIVLPLAILPVAVVQPWIISDPKVAGEEKLGVA